MDWQIRMNQVIEYLESKMYEDIDMNKAVRCSGYTLLDFQRIFSFLTNTTVVMYIRRRRLSLAADDIVSGKEKIVDIALKYGYESPAAFSRAFRQLFGVSPSSAREGGATLVLYPKLSFNNLEESKVIAMNDMDKYSRRGCYVTSLMPAYLTKDMDKTSEWFRDILGWFGCTIAHDDEGNGVYGAVYDYPAEIFNTVNPQRGFYMFYGEPSQGTVAYLHQQGSLDNLYEFVRGNGWNNITIPTDNGCGGRECSVTTIDGSILHFDEP